MLPSTPMHVRVVRPTRLTPEELDEFLHRGWFRIGQALMTCRVVQFEGVLRPAIWTRQVLDRYEPTRSNRKLMARNARRFRVEFGEVRLDEEHEALYQRYRGSARGERSENLIDFLYGESSVDVFPTREVRVLDEGRLVAFSWFDVGRDTVQSLMGVYDPALARHSLGYWTMLLEIAHARATGRRFFYPGYVLPGEPAMDYKLRLGEVEFLHPDAHAWRPLPELAAVELPTRRLERALEQAAAALAAVGIPSRQVAYPWFEAPAWQPDLTSCLDQPLVLWVHPDQRGPMLVLTYDLDRGVWSLLRCLRARAVTRARSEVETPIELWLVADRLGSHPTPEAAAEAAVRMSRGLWMART